MSPPPAHGGTPINESADFNWSGKRVVVTGGAGFVGSYLVEDLLRRGADITIVDDFSSGLEENLTAVDGSVRVVRGDLRDPLVSTESIRGADVVMHLAARAFGMLFSASHHDEVLRDNVFMGFNVLDAIREHDVPRALMVSSSCVYDDGAVLPTPELPVQIGLPESVNEGYGWAKRLLEIQSRYIHDRYGLPIAIVRPFNAYGGRYKWQGSASHVVPSLVKRVLDGDDPVVVWGSGEQVRDLLHAQDFAQGFRMAAESATDCEPINLAGGFPIRLKDLVHEIARSAGMEVNISLDRTKGDGRRRKEADLTRLKERLPNFTPEIDLQAGIADMRRWYERNAASGAFHRVP